MKNSFFFTLLCILTFSTLFLNSCNEDYLIEEIQKDETQLLDITEDERYPKITADLNLFNQLPDSLSEWLHSFSETQEDNEVEMRGGGIRHTYRMYMAGHTLGGQYPFRRYGCLNFRNTVRVGSSINHNNGRNPFDMAMFSGMPVQGDKGSIWFMTNTALCALNDDIGCLDAAAGLDVVRMTYDSKDRLVIIDLDGGFVNNAGAGNSLTGMLNIFNTTSWSAAYRIVSGRIVIQFSEDFKSLAGAMLVNGSNFGTAPVDYYAQFVARASSRCNP